MENKVQDKELAMENRQLSIEEFLQKDEQKDLLRFLTAGSVDDGKSTLIGRLLFDSKKSISVRVRFVKKNYLGLSWTQLD